MIGFLTGKVLFSDGEECILLTSSGIGYEIHYGHILAEDDQGSLYISHIVRENAEDLYGFRNLQEKKTFEWLLKVKGVGPKSAFSLINSLGTHQLCQAIVTENKALLQKAPGIGTKAASQIILDLKNKVEKTKIYQNLFSTSTTGDEEVNCRSHFPVKMAEEENINCLQDALMACRELGFQDQDVLPKLKAIMKEKKIQKAEQLVHLVLKQI